MLYVCVVQFMNSFPRSACVSELLADFNGQKKMLKNRRGEGQTEKEGGSGWRAIRHLV